MAKFNCKSYIKTKNLSMHEAYQMTDKEKLVTQVLTSLFNESKFYKDNSEDIVNTVQKVIKEDPKFIANLCVYTRKEMHLRTISQVLIGELAKVNKGKPYVRRSMNNCIFRVDDMTEILAYYINKYGKPIPNSIKKGIGDKLLSF